MGRIRTAGEGDPEIQSEKCDLRLDGCRPMIATDALFLGFYQALLGGIRSFLKNQM